MSFQNKSAEVTLVARRGFTFGPRTFLKRYKADESAFVNDGFEAQFEVTCTKGGEAIFVANSEDSGSGLTIDPDEILITLELSPDQTEALDFDCCEFILFYYKGDVLAPDEKHLITYGNFIVNTVGASEGSS